MGADTAAFWNNLKPIAASFYVSIRFNLENGRRIQFSNDIWIQGLLRERYPALYEQSDLKNGSVCQMKGEGNWNFGLRNHVSEEVKIEENMLRI